MATIDLRNQIVYATGTWQDAALLANETPFVFTLADTLTASRLILRWAGDAVTLAGPLRLKITFQAENITFGVGTWTPPAKVTARQGGGIVGYQEPITYPTGLSINTNGGTALVGAGSLQASTVYSYTLDVPAGQVWPFSFDPSLRYAELANNSYERVLIEVAGLEALPQPVAASCELPCDFAVADRPDAGTFFPAACEPCDPGAMMRMPALAPALSVHSADGGVVRTRFFNGMFITREDLETEQRYVRIKNRLRNRAAGQGVVWGLNVGKAGEQICVLPGYGVDCCGNDLTVTSVYRVDIAALLRDPAAIIACSPVRTGPQCMHLLLEYVECPSEPRPVHSDPCGPTNAACEPSRIRETVRLRLIPPREPDPTGPLQKFLTTADALHAKYGQRVETVTDLPATSEVDLTFRADGLDASIGAGESAVSLGTPDPAVPVTIGARADDPFSAFTGGTLRITTPAGVLVSEAPLALQSIPGAIGLPLTLDLTVASAYVVELANWRVESALAPAPGWADTGTAVFDLVASPLGTWSVTGRAVTPPVRVVPNRVAVCDPCAVPELPAAPGGAPIRPPNNSGGVNMGPSFARVFTTLPSLAAAVRPAAARDGVWLHADPLAPERAGDPKAVMLGVVAAWLQSSQAGASEAGVSEPWSLSRVAAATIYRAAWLLFYGVDATDDKCDVADAVQTLLRDWCAAALYPGPICPGEPHGVVIGSTVLSAGSIGDIDPFGGRRYVVQYPLLAHWGAQIGLTPPDLVATRLFSTLCCVASLAKPTTGVGTAALVEIAEVEGDDGASATPVYVGFGTEAAVSAEWVRQTGTPWDVAVTHEVSAAQFAIYAISALNGSLPPTTLDLEVGNGAQVVERYTVDSLVEAGVLSILVGRTLGGRVIAGPAAARRRARGPSPSPVG